MKYWLHHIFSFYYLSSAGHNYNTIKYICFISLWQRSDIPSRYGRETKGSYLEVVFCCWSSGRRSVLVFLLLASPLLCSLAFSSCASLFFCFLPFLLLPGSLCFLSVSCSSSRLCVIRSSLFVLSVFTLSPVFACSSGFLSIFFSFVFCVPVSVLVRPVCYTMSVSLYPVLLWFFSPFRFFLVRVFFPPSSSCPFSGFYNARECHAFLPL